MSVFVSPVNTCGMKSRKSRPAGCRHAVELWGAVGSKNQRLGIHGDSVFCVLPAVHQSRRIRPIETMAQAYSLCLPATGELNKRPVGSATWNSS